MLYEALTGELPFNGDRREDVSHAVLNHELLLGSETDFEIPANLQRIIARALSKSPVNRYQSISEILAEFESSKIGQGFILPTEHLTAWEPQPSIAVLAFEDLSPARDQAYFCDGIAEEIINNLAQVDGLGVASRTSSFAYKGRQEDVRDTGINLGVQSVYYLKKAVEAGYAHRQYLEKDSDFDSIREHPGYKALIKHLKGREKESRAV